MDETGSDVEHKQLNFRESDRKGHCPVLQPVWAYPLAHVVSRATATRITRRILKHRLVAAPPRPPSPRTAIATTSQHSATFL
jgi:hypothetical protein